VRILFLSRDFSGASLCRRLALEGNEVRALVSDPGQCRTLGGMVERAADLESGLSWLGPGGLVVCDDVGFGELQDDLRRRGHAVVGGSKGGDRLELDRAFAQELFASLGMSTEPSLHFSHPDEAADFVRRNPGKWVVKGNGHSDKTLAYVGKLDDAADILDLLEHYGRHADCCGPVDLQKVILGVEIAVARYFNGRDWVGPIEMSKEHKHFFNHGVGPLTCEMGTLMWYDHDEGNKLFRRVLAPLAPYLRESGFRGDLGINCIVTREDAYPLEATSRFGYPATQLQMALHRSPWGDFLRALAAGDDYPLEVRDGFGVVVLVAAPSFPFHPGGQLSSSNGLRVRFREPLTDEEMSRIHFEGVELRRESDGAESYHLCDDTGYALHVTGTGPTVEEARRAAYALAEKVVIPRMYYRHDIGLRFLERDRALLHEWGYL
jgi:phosphoribosylamine--glycine ligase